MQALEEDSVDLGMVSDLHLTLQDTFEHIIYLLT